MACVELPKDMEGCEIPLNTAWLYDDNGNAYEVQTYCYAVHEEMPDRKWEALLFSKKSVELRSIRTTTLCLTPPDTWAKLEDDLDRCIEDGNPCMYFSPEGSCSTCSRPDSDTCGCTASVFNSIKKRIRKLRGEV